MEEAKGSAGGEARRVHVVYYLSHRNGKLEHPHLIRVHHFRRNGVRLRDVKSWLSELRGNELPELFAWSYKRRYKNGYIWQDLMDDDLITPISDNEYVLKGSELLIKINDSLLTPLDAYSYSSRHLGAATPATAAVHPEEVAEEKPSTSPAVLNTAREQKQMEIPQKSYLPSLPPAVKDGDSNGSSPEPPPPSSNTSTERAAVLEKQHCNKPEKKKEEEENRGGADERSFSVGRRSTGGLLRDILGCRTTATNDDVVVPGGGRCRDLSVGGQGRRVHGQHNFINTSNGSCGLGSSKKTGGRSIPAAYRPVGEPRCSQCGKKFKPDKLHSHMKSCKALKGKARS